MNFDLLTWNLYRFFSSFEPKSLQESRITDTLLSKKCEIVRTREQSLNLYSGAWFYFFSKIIDLLDTCFFVLRKKQNQVTFLHVYHHTITALFSWMYLKYAPGMNRNNSWVIIVIYFIYFFIYTLYTFCFRRTRRCNWHSEFRRTHCHVLLLYGFCYGSTIPKVFVVEKVHDQHSISPICSYHGLYGYHCIEGLQYAQDPHFLLHCKHLDILVFVWQFLQKDI